MRVREMTAGDLQAVSRLAEQLVQLHHGWDATRFFITPDVASGYRHFFASQLGRDGVVLLTAEVVGALAGYLYAAAGNPQAQALFRRLGYRPSMVEMTLDLPGAASRGR